jgi:hypothetical protein
MGRPAIVPLTFLKINASVNIRHVSVVATSESSLKKYARRKQRGSEQKCMRHCNEYDRSIVMAPLTAPTKCRHVFLLNEPDVRRFIINKLINNNYKNVPYKIVN